MTGLEAISHHNGWSMAVAGALIVFSGLVVLSFTISQLHRILALMERKKTPVVPQEMPMSATHTPPPHHFPLEAAEAALLYHSLVDKLGDRFRLSELYDLTRKEGYPHPHLTINSLRAAGFLLPAGNGVYSWHLDPTNPS